MTDNPLKDDPRFSRESITEDFIEDIRQYVAGEAYTSRSRGAPRQGFGVLAGL